MEGIDRKVAGPRLQWWSVSIVGENETKGSGFSVIKNIVGNASEKHLLAEGPDFSEEWGDVCWRQQLMCSYRQQ